MRGKSGTSLITQSAELLETKPHYTVNKLTRILFISILQFLLKSGSLKQKMLS